MECTIQTDATSYPLIHSEASLSQQTKSLPKLGFDVPEAVRILRLSRATLYERIRAGLIRPQKDGPKKRETQLAVVGHMRFMQGNGRGGWAGAQTIGETTDQNKATVLKHRAEAIREGWLVLALEGKSKRPGWGQDRREVPGQSCPTRQDRVSYGVGPIS